MGHAWYYCIGGFYMLKEYRERAKISQNELEEKTNIDRKTIFRIENDINIPLLDTFAKMVIALNLTDEEIAKEVKKSIEKKKQSNK